MSDLVSLLYRADWTRLSLTAEVGVSRDHDLSRSRFESGAPQPPPLGVPWGVPWSVPWRGGPWSGPSSGTLSGPEREMAADVPGPEEGRSTVLIAPGRRYRQQGGSYLSGCDGNRSWLAVASDDGWTVVGTGGPNPPLTHLLRPSWLLTGFTLEPGGTVTVGGRDVLRAVATPRPGLRAWTWPRRPLDRVEVTVDAELGILLRCEEVLDGRPLSVTELADVGVNPAQAGDDARFQPPGGWDSVDDKVPWFVAPGFAPRGPGWEVAKLAAGLAAGGFGALIRSSPFRPFEQATQEEAKAEMPAPEDGPWPGDGEPADGSPADGSRADGSPAGDEVLRLLHASWDGWAPAGQPHRPGRAISRRGLSRRHPGRGPSLRSGS